MAPLVDGQVPDITFPIAFAFGTLSFLSPCVLPLVPVYLANIAGTSVLSVEPPGRRYVMLHTISFIAGFSLVFTVLGASLGLLGAMVPYGVLRNVAGTLLITFGAFLLAAMKVPWLNYERRLDFTKAKGSGYARSLVLGAVFSLGWTPCVGPVLGGILAMASQSQTAWQGVSLLLTYCVGLGAPFVIAGLALGTGAGTTALRWLSRHAVATSAISAALLITVGVLILLGKI